MSVSEERDDFAKLWSVPNLLGNLYPYEYSFR